MNQQMIDIVVRQITRSLERNEHIPSMHHEFTDLENLDGCKIGIQIFLIPPMNTTLSLGDTNNE